MDDPDLFRVETVETAAAPAGMESDSWCRYVITNRRSRVVGRYRGTLAQTRRNAEQLARSINERALGVRSAWTPRSQGRPKSAGRQKTSR